MTEPRLIHVVDDEEGVLRTLRRFLSRDGFRVEVARSAEEAMGQLDRGLAPQVVISDYRMPGTDGVQFLRMVRERWPRVQRILMTGHADIQSIEEAINTSRIYRFLGKPWEESNLLATVRSAVEQWELEEENARLLALIHEQNRQLLEANQELEAKVMDRTALLSRAKREWEVAFDALSDPLMVIDAEYRIVRANIALAAHLGQPIRTLPGQLCHEVRARSRQEFPREPAGPCRGCPVARAKETGEDLEVEIETVGERVFQVGAFPMNEGDRQDTVCVYRDLTDKRQLARQLAQADKLSAIGLLAGGVAHEINNPLGAILAFSQLMRREKLSEDETQDYLKEIEESALRCKRIVERLLSFARQQKREDRRTFSLNDVVGETVFLVEKSYLPSGVRLERDLDPEIWPVLGNPNEISQVLLNLITNARDALPSGGVVKVRTRNVAGGGGADTVELSVVDTGLGMPTHVIERIFDPFFTTKPEGKGTGLGLSVSYGIVRDHRGRIHVRSKVGEGTEFQVLLPRAGGSSIRA